MLDLASTRQLMGLLRNPALANKNGVLKDSLLWTCQLSDEELADCLLSLDGYDDFMCNPGDLEQLE